MSFNRSMYDTCSYARDLKDNVSILSYVLSPYRYEHQEKCRHNLGLVGGTAVSHVQGNMVDLESDLRGQTRLLSKCTSHYASPVAEGGVISNDKTAPIDTSKKHLPSCQMISYRSVPLPRQDNYSKCR